MPKISIVMPVYNTEKFLDESITSILNQSFQDFEFIIVDDNSTDSSVLIIEKYRDIDDRIILIKNKNNLGNPGARNMGLKIAKGKYIAAFDSDDICIPNRLEVEYNFLEKNTDIFLVGSGAYIIDENGKVFSKYKQICNSKKILNKLPIGNLFYHPSIMYRNIGLMYREKFIYAQDYDFYLRLLSLGKKLENLPEYLFKYRINAGSVSLKNVLKQKMFGDIARKFYYERKNTGKDSYEEFNNNDVLEFDLNSDKKLLLEIDIIANFKLNDFIKTKIKCKEYFFKYGFFNKYIFYFILSFFGRRVVYTVKNILGKY